MYFALLRTPPQKRQSCHLSDSQHFFFASPSLGMSEIRALAMMSENPTRAAYKASSVLNTKARKTH
jgi:hypothetical protein